MTTQKLNAPQPLAGKISTVRPTLGGMFENLPDLLTVQDMKSLTGLSEQTIRSEIRGGSIPGCRIGRRLYVPKTNFIKYVLEGGGLND